MFVGRPGYKFYQINQIREKKRYQFRFHPLHQNKTTLALHYDSTIDVQAMRPQDR